MSIDLGSALRRYRPERRRDRLTPRPHDQLIGAEAATQGTRQSIVLDTNVYILDRSGRLPATVAVLLDNSLLFHCSVSLAELSTGIGNADPGRATWRTMRDAYADLFDAIPANRILTPDAQTWLDAGLIAGILARTQGFQRHQRKECLNDALIYLTAARAGLPVLTADHQDFDLIQQLAPGGAVVCF